ncbi:MAG: hypothetical protein IKI28_06430 [Bacteroidales bacterium]|nr:hypothetical protein [Bacteroidales bacterium]
MKVFFGWLLFGILIIVFGLWGFDGNWKLLLIVVVLSSIAAELVRLLYRKRKEVDIDEDLYLQDVILKRWSKRKEKQKQSNAQ